MVCIVSKVWMCFLILTIVGDVYEISGFNSLGIVHVVVVFVSTVSSLCNV